MTAPEGADVRAASPPRVTVRQATVADLAVVVRLRLALLREHPDHAIYGRLRPDAEARAHDLFAAQLRSTSEAILLAEARARSVEVVGILRCVEMQASPLFVPERYGYVSSVYVRPESRRQGVLRALLAQAERWCAARRLGELRLHNVPDGTAEQAWSALGFALVEQVRLKRL